MLTWKDCIEINLKDTNCLMDLHIFRRFYLMN